MTSKKKIALYARYSTHNQDNNFSIDIQIERMQALCKSKGWEKTEQFIDAAYTGSNLERPALQNMLLRLKEFDAVVVYRLDRLSRSQRDTMSLIQDYFLKNDVAFISVSETLDTTTPFGMAMIGILAVFAELERATITERMQAGIKRRVADGYWQTSGNYMPTGYDRAISDDGTGILVVNEYEAEHVQLMYDVFEKHHSIVKVQDVLKERGFEKRRFTTVRQILSNRVYIGEVSYKGEHYKGVHTPLIDIEQFERVQKILDNKPKGANAGKAKESLFAGLIKCGSCGEPFSAYSYKVKLKNSDGYYVRSYICNAKRYPRHYDYTCDVKAIKHDALEELMLSSLDDILRVEVKDVKVKKKVVNYDAAIKKIDEKIMRLLDLYEDGAVDKNTFNERMARRNEEKAELVRKQKEQTQEKTSSRNIDDVRERTLDFNDLGFHEKKAFIQSFVNSVTVTNEEVSFDWNF